MRPLSGTGSPSRIGSNCGRSVAQSGHVQLDQAPDFSQRQIGTEQGMHWSSKGEGEFEVATVEKADRGTKIVLHLKSGESEFADSTVTTVIEEAKRVVKAKKLPMQFSIVQPFYDQPEYLDALVAAPDRPRTSRRSVLRKIACAPAWVSISRPFARAS